MQVPFITAIVAAASVLGQSAAAPPCPDSRYPSCLVAAMDAPDAYASYRVPAPPAVPKWTAFVKSLGDQTTYPWAATAPSPKSNDGGATGGGPNGKGAAWGTLENKATEVFACPAGQWALTFDDGPVLTDQSMAILKANNVVGTFFLVGSKIAENTTHAKFVQDLYDAGHQIALHSWTHRQISLQSTDEVIAELIFNILAVYNVIGKVPRYFRPAYSAIDDRVRNILVSMGLRPVIWNIETLDADVGGPAPGGIDIISSNVTVADALAHTKSDFEAKSDPRWSYFPSKTPIPGTVPTRYTYDGFISLQHDISAAHIQVAQVVVPFAAKSGFKSVYVNACDQIMPDASFYLDDNSVLTQFIKSIKLPLTAADLAPFTGSFAAVPAGGASIGGAVATPKSGAASSVIPLASVFASALMAMVL